MNREHWSRESVKDSVQKMHLKIGSSFTNNMNNNTPTSEAPNYQVHSQKLPNHRSNTVKEREETEEGITSRLYYHVKLHNQASAFPGSIEMRVLQIVSLNSSH